MNPEPFVRSEVGKSNGQPTFNGMTRQQIVDYKYRGKYSNKVYLNLLDY